MVCLGDLGRVLGDVPVIGQADTRITGVACDSRMVNPGDLFVCVTGFSSDGHRFAKDAVEKGARALIVEREPDGVQGIPYIRVANSRRALAMVSAELMGRPADKMLNIGITGTNGKTTTSYLVEAVMRAKGLNPGLLGTIEAKVGDSKRQLSNTTPESLDLHKMFREMVASGQDSVVMEVSSHALALDRTYQIPYDIAVFTNLTQDHLDFHGDMEDYFWAKAKLFTRLGTYGNRAIGPFAVVNIDDPYAGRLCQLLRHRVPVFTYGTSSHADVRAFDVEAGPGGLSYTLETRLGNRRVDLQLSGMFNLHNSLAAVAVGFALRTELDAIVAAIESVSAIPGRFQLVRAGQPFTVVVDYAHTPDGLDNLLDSVRAITNGRVSLVFGCGGDRDKSKRAKMGAIAAGKADRVIITTDNPRSEEPESIVEQIMQGVSNDKWALVDSVPDRAQAIAKAIDSAAAGDAVVIAGKGHETYQKFSQKTVHFDDVETALECLQRYPFAQPGPMPKVKLQINWDRSALNRSALYATTAKSS